MWSVRSRLSDSSTLRLIVSGRLSTPVDCAGRELEAELGRDHDLVADRFERLADELLVGERAVDLRGVEEGDAALDGCRGCSAIDSLRSGNGGKLWLMPMQPSPIAETSRLSPSVRFSIASPFLPGDELERRCPCFGCDDCGRSVALKQRPASGDRPC